METDNCNKRPNMETEFAEESSASSGPKAKVPKLNAGKCKISFNEAYMMDNFMQTLIKNWNAPMEKSVYHDAGTGAQVFTDPFQICLLPELLESKHSSGKLVKEMIEKVHWSRKQMDLYEFYQSTDISNMSESKWLARFLHMLRRQVRPWLEKVTNLKLDYVSASCSMYNCGDYLLVHDDLLKDRQIAFVYYLSPWEDTFEWTEGQGGCLELFSSDEQRFPYFPVQRKIAPRDNQFAFFKVGVRSFHQVGEVTTYDYPRLTINGWFHGASNENLIVGISRPINLFEFKFPHKGAKNELNTLVNNIYLKRNTSKIIQKRIEANSEICLYHFLQSDVFTAVLHQLLKDVTLQWRQHGPANTQNYEVLDISKVSGAIAQLITMFSSQTMFTLLHSYTDLDLAGPNVECPSFVLEVQRWSHGSYTVLGDGTECEENTLDLIYYLNSAKGAGIFTYLPTELDPQSEVMQSSASDSDDDEQDNSPVCLTITPVDNALNMVYRTKGTVKFMKYISRNTPLEKGPVFIILCSYRE